ncbi:MAG: protein kinase, partial [Gemmataceae bacterium]|nr:protein kinase [Gemmataceae bacterium]
MRDHDEQLASLIDRLAAEQRAGRADIDAVATAYPELAAELRELWAVAQFAHLARPKSGPQALTLPHIDTPASLPGDPPVTGDPALPRAFGDFELLEEIGRGGMGVVYKARQRSLNRVVALKMVREAHLSTADDRARFRTEAESAARLKHPNIVTVHEVGTAGGQAYLCMEFVGGQ